MHCCCCNVAVLWRQQKLCCQEACSKPACASLQDHGPLTERQAALVLYECLKVVAACHAEGLVHGDVKPANFLLKQRMRNPLALIDFGCSQDTRGAQLSRRTGTPGVHAVPAWHDSSCCIAHAVFMVTC
jgi:serine/threonine protein kinase